MLSFGPDTGHLFWGGSDPAVLVADYADRVRAVHLKDVHRGGGRRGARADATTTGRRRTSSTSGPSPGRGDVDFDAVFAALPASYDGWFVVEVDVPDLPTKEESTAESARWVAAMTERSSG